MSGWLVTGAGGQVATHVVARLRELDANVTACSRAELDIADAASVRAVLDRVQPDVVVNTAAYTKVDAAENEADAAHRANATGPQVLAEELTGASTRLLHVSTDYVFDGTASAPYDVDDPTGPRTVYGRTKLAGEQAVRAQRPQGSCIVRTAWVCGGPGPNFIDTMLRLEGERERLTVVDDQIGSPTTAADLGAALVELGRAPGDLPGIVHYVNAGQASWCDLAREVFRLAGADPSRVEAIDSASYAFATPRPAWSVLTTRSWTAAGLSAPRPWQQAVADVVRAR
ncbi:dTDP-4-dehydrorhamnose reductase [uncultured Jatrophihabitans sp.]|uniref:dTDP-4-dehydrorhamnose reductase n=1 Tax=uncultured Jatrophihabitans sp. TaxID=1610747 RepID=UPI0035CC41AE